MTLPIILLLLLVGSIPMLGVGLWLAVAGKTIAVKFLGGMIAFLGFAPVLFALFYLYWLFFHSN